MNFINFRAPQSLDTTHASRPLEPIRLQEFKHALPGPRAVSYFEDDGPLSMTQHDDADTDGRSLIYPAMLFQDFPKLPNVHVLSAMLADFSNRFCRHAPFLSSCMLHPQSLLHREAKPYYLTFAMALVGTMVSDRPDMALWRDSLWRAAARVHSSSVEVNNKVARRVSWTMSFTLLATCGILHGDAAMWSEVNMFNGHVETSAKRIGLDKISLVSYAPMQSQSQATEQRDHGKIMAYYFLIDTLRSLQTFTPTSFHPHHMSIPLSDGTSFAEIWQQLRHGSPPDDMKMTPDDALLFVVSVLSETLSLHQWLAPLACSEISNSTDIFATSAYSNPHFGLNPWMEYQRLVKRLRSVMDRLENIFRRLSLDSDPVFRHALPLTQFTRMVLSGGFQVLSLPAIVGYCAGSDFALPEGIPDDAVPALNDECLHHALSIVELVDAPLTPRPDKSASAAMTPLWQPTVLFSAGLVIWTRLRHHRTAPATELRPYYPQTLWIVELQLRHMHWPNGLVMAGFLERLRSQLDER